MLDAAATTGVPMKPLCEDLSPRVTELSCCYAGQKRTIDQMEEQTEKLDLQQTFSASLPHREEQFYIFDESSQSTVKSDTQVRALSRGVNDGHGLLILNSSKAAPQPDHKQTEEQQREPSRPKMGVSPKANVSGLEVPATSVPSDPDARKAFIQQVRR